MNVHVISVRYEWANAQDLRKSHYQTHMLTHPGGVDWTTVFEYVSIEGTEWLRVQRSETDIMNSGYQLESDTLTVRHNKREPRGQPFPSR